MCINVLLNVVVPRGVASSVVARLSIADRENGFSHKSLLCKLMRKVSDVNRRGQIGI